MYVNYSSTIDGRRMSEDVVVAPSVHAFESRLDKAWKDQPTKLNYNEELCLQLYDLDIEETSSWVQNYEEEEDDDDDDDVQYS